MEGIFTAEDAEDGAEETRKKGMRWGGLLR
jgi:hypothetical protein